MSEKQPLRLYQQYGASIIKKFLQNCCSSKVQLEEQSSSSSSSSSSTSSLRCSLESLQSVTSSSSTKTTSALLYLPTGGGKTRIASTLTLWTRRHNGRILFLVNRLQLAIQAKEAFLKEGIDEDDICVIEKGSKEKFDRKPIIIATIQSLTSRRRRRIQQVATNKIEKTRINTVIAKNDAENYESEEEDNDIEDHAIQSRQKNKDEEEEEDDDDDNDNDDDENDMKDFPLADLVIIDEAHGAVADSYTPLIHFYMSRMGASKQEWKKDEEDEEEVEEEEETYCNEKDKKRIWSCPFILGMTATPTRLQGEERLEQVFQRLIRGPSVSQLVTEKVLVIPIPIRTAHELTQMASKPLLQRAFRNYTTSSSSISAFQVQGMNRNVDDDDHDYNKDDFKITSKKSQDDLFLQKTLEEEKVLNHVVKTWKHYCQKKIKVVTNDFSTSNTRQDDSLSIRKTIVFASSVKHSRAIVSAFIANNVSACHVDGNTSITDRERIYTDLKVGNINVLSSVGVVCEGYDEPSVSCVVLLRPTASRGLYVQQVGRGLRSYPEKKKKDCLVLDFVDNTLRHGPVTTPINCSLDDSYSSLTRISDDSIGVGWVCSDPKCRAISHTGVNVCILCNQPRNGKSTSSSSSSSLSSLKSISVPISSKSTRLEQTRSPFANGFESIKFNVSDLLSSTEETKNEPSILLSPQKSGSISVSSKSIPRASSDSTSSSTSDADTEDVDSLVNAISNLGIGSIQKQTLSSGHTSHHIDKNIQSSHSNKILISNKSSVPIRHSSVGVPIRPPFHSLNKEAVVQHGIPIRPPFQSTLRTNVEDMRSISILNSSSTNNNNTGIISTSINNRPLQQSSSSSRSSSQGGPFHTATPDIFKSLDFRSACVRHNLNEGDRNLLGYDLSFIYDNSTSQQKGGGGGGIGRWIHSSSGLTDFDASFLLSIAAQITPFVEHEWKSKGREQSKGLSDKQMGHLTTIVKKVKAYTSHQSSLQAVT
jgi:superfamily II DNA or RNA helicase